MFFGRHVDGSQPTGTFELFEILVDDWFNPYPVELAGLPVHSTVCSLYRCDVAVAVVLYSFWLSICDELYTLSGACVFVRMWLTGRTSFDRCTECTVFIVVVVVVAACLLAACESADGLITFRASSTELFWALTGIPLKLFPYAVFVGSMPIEVCSLCCLSLVVDRCLLGVVGGFGSFCGAVSPLWAAWSVVPDVWMNLLNSFMKLFPLPLGVTLDGRIDELYGNVKPHSPVLATLATFTVVSSIVRLYRKHEAAKYHVQPKTSDSFEQKRICTDIMRDHESDVVKLSKTKTEQKPKRKRKKKTKGKTQKERRKNHIRWLNQM